MFFSVSTSFLFQGQVIEVSGAMSGGGGRPLSGRIMADIVQVKKLHEANYSCESRHKRLSTDSSKETNDLSALERQLTQGDAELGRLRDTRSRLEEMIVRMTRQRDESERTIKRCEVSCSLVNLKIIKLFLCVKRLSCFLICTFTSEYCNK